MSATGNLGMDPTAEGEAGNPGVVATSKEEGNEVLGAAALGTEKPKETGTKPRRKLPVPTYIVEENKKNLQQQRKKKPANLNIPKEKNNEINIEDSKMKQPTLKEFAQFTKKKIDEKEVMEEEHFFNQKDPEDKSREATSLEVFNGFCHMEERFHQAIKANDEKWKVVKRIDENRIVALTRMVKSQANRLRQLETSHKKLMEGNLQEIMELNNKIYMGDFRKATNKAKNDL